MSDTKNNHQLRKSNWFTTSLFVVFLIAWQLPDVSILHNVVLMSLPTHTFAETFSIIVSMLVFAIVFSTPKDNRTGKAIGLACAFFMVGLLDFAHTLSYDGMPDFVTPGSKDKSIYFWLVARYVAAIALFVTALQIWHKVPLLLSRYWLLLASIILTAFLYWLGLYHLDVLPHSFIEGQGLTSFKIGAEYGIIAILVVAAVLFYLQMKRSQSLDASSLYTATIITILSELCFTLYANITGVFILLGHIYKVIAYIYIFRAIFVFIVKEPYQKLSESEKYNRTLFESSSIGLAVCKMDGSLLDINQSYADIIGRSIKDTLKLTYWEITPDDYMDQEEIQLKNLATKKRYGPYEKEYLHKDGHRVPVRLSGSIIERNGEALIWSSTEDISEEIAAKRASYESEQHLRQLAEHIREVFWLSDIHKDQIIYVSPAYEIIWGLSCQSLYDNPTSFLDAIHEEDRERIKQVMVHQKEGPYSEEYRILRPDGTVRWIKDQSFPIQNHTGVTYRIAGIAEDITEVKLARELLEQRVYQRTESLHQKENELIASKEEAERANLAKSQFLSSMSHELRTPLNAILGFAQLLQLEGNLNRQQNDSISEIITGGNHLLNLINEVLDLAKVETGNYEINPTRNDVRKMLIECMTLSSPLQTQYEISLSVNIDDAIEADVYADVTRLKQIFLNLISNACKYNIKGGTVEIKCNYVTESHIRISVKDSGKGIPKKHHAGVFEPFNRLGAKHGNIEGTGIGLTITKQLVEMMGGHIGFESEPGLGSLFWVDLPLYNSDSNTTGQVSPETSPIEKLKPELANQQTGVTAQYNILYIEDNLSNLSLVKQIFKQRPDYNLITAIKPIEGIELACQTKPDLVLLDINLPGMNGYQVMEKLRMYEETRNIPVIAVTANAMADDANRGLGVGFKDYITKPINVPSFLKAIDQWLVNR